VAADDSQQVRCAAASSSDDIVQSLTPFIAGCGADKPTGAPPPSAAASNGNPIDKLYSMQASYFTAN